VEEVDKEEDIPTEGEKGGGVGIAVMLKNSMGDWVKGGSDLRKDASEEIEADTIIRIR